MKWIVPALYFVCIAFLFAGFGYDLHSQSVDVVSHDALIDALMKRGTVNPVDDAYLGWGMPSYPPLSHWAAAILGKIIGSGLRAMWLIALSAIFICYASIGNMLTSDRSVLAILVFIGLFGWLTPTHALVGWEVVENFFYPHLISVAIYFCVLNWIIQTHPSSIRIAVVTSILTPIIYLVQPIGGVYLSATVLAIFAVDIFRAILHRQMNRAAFIGGFIVLACTLASLRIPQVRALMSYASNDGWLYFNIPDNSFWILFMGFAAFSVLNLMLSMRRLPDRILGAAGSAALMLMIIQDLALTIFHQGSFYAVKKQGFMVLTLGAVNAARLLARYAPAWKSEYVRLIVPCTALLTTCVALWGPGFDLDPIIKAQNAGNALASQAPAKTVADISKYSTFNMLVTVTAFRGSMEELYHGVTKQLTESAPFLFVRQSLRDQACTVIIEKGFAIIRQPCPAGVSTATP